MAKMYYRNPLVHAVVLGGLPLVADWIRNAIKSGMASADTIPCSIEQIAEPGLLDYLTASAVMALKAALPYPAEVVEMAADVSERPVSQ
jgi:hypothetical protein